MTVAKKRSGATSLSSKLLPIMSRHRAQQLASEFLARAGAKGWFEALYAEAGDDYAAVPWADLAPNPNLVEWSIAQG